MLRTYKEVERVKTAQLPEIDETQRFLGQIGLGKIEETALDEQTCQINRVARRKHLGCLAGPAGFPIDMVHGLETPGVTADGRAGYRTIPGELEERHSIRS